MKNSLGVDYLEYFEEYQKQLNCWRNSGYGIDSNRWKPFEFDVSAAKQRKLRENRFQKG